MTSEAVGIDAEIILEWRIVVCSIGSCASPRGETLKIYGGADDFLSYLSGESEESEGLEVALWFNCFKFSCDR